VAAPTPLPQIQIPPAAYAGAAANRAAIKTFVDGYVQRLLNDSDALNQGIAREELAKATMEKSQPAQPEFLFEYAKMLNDALLPQIQGGKASMRQRLNIAIVAQRVATVSENSALAPLVVALINDKHEPIVLWGIKAAGPIIKASVKMAPGANAPGAVAAAAPAPPILKAIVPAVLNHPSGEIYEEAYGALTTSGEKIVIDELMKVWENRLNQYRAGVPENASADAKPVLTLTGNQMWMSVLKDKAQRDRVMQMIMDQICLAAQRADLPAHKDKRDQLAMVVKRTAEGIVVVALNQKIQDLAAAAEPATKINPENPPPKIAEYVIPAIPQAIQKAFPDVKPPQPAAAGVAQQPQ
jgi:hypothetical protein